MSTLVTTLVLAVLLVGTAVLTFGTHIVPAVRDAGESTAQQMKEAFP
ncbi:MAG: hypothetical protein KGO83_01265 [Paenibacillaceae bacterium]|jgi:hypothetical protein|nr:hypothetical protein [Paenibacillaceae bacterium]